jgi:signal peptide peptidase SppA
MLESPFGAILFAMHPAFLDSWIRTGMAERLTAHSVSAPEASVVAAARGNPDPIREGATVVIPIRGMLGPTGLGRPTTATDVLAERVRGFAADPKVGAIVLDVQSPGGYVFGTQEAGDAIFEARASKPVVAVANQFAFSAAHWLASQASEFWATPSGEVGSVGVRAAHLDASGFEERIGFKTTLIASHPDKISGHPFAPLSEADLAEIQMGVDESNTEFVAAIARGRGIKVGDVAAIHGTGKTFSAKRALGSGAIDGIATLREVVGKLGSSRSRLALMRRNAAALEQLAAI